MFDNLSDKLNTVFKKLKGHGKLTEKNITDGLKEVRMALLEADVHYKVVKTFVAGIKERALGQEVMTSLTPGQQVIKIVNEELTALMGGEHQDLVLTGTRPVAVMLVGLQGSGKTTTAGKLAVHLRKIGNIRGIWGALTLMNYPGWGDTDLQHATHYNEVATVRYVSGSVRIKRLATPC